MKNPAAHWGVPTSLLGPRSSLSLNVPPDAFFLADRELRLCTQPLWVCRVGVVDSGHPSQGSVGVVLEPGSNWTVSSTVPPGNPHSLDSRRD